MRFLLYPAALLYGLAILVRNKMFDWRVLRSKKFSIPVITIGNLVMGGTGKTPHTEYLVKLLKTTYQLAIISRGHKRNTKGLVRATTVHGHKDIGDEPRQYKQKFQEIDVLVDKNRCRAVEAAMGLNPDLGAILLDDAYQYRFLMAGLSIILTDFHNLYVNNFLFPTGTLREYRCGAHRADVIIVTKTPRVFSPITRRRLIKELKPLDHQKIFFSYIRFLPLQPMKGLQMRPPQERYSTILMLAGIANPYPLKEELMRKCTEVVEVRYPDHHDYTRTDVQHVLDRYNNIISSNKVIVTTEKDMMRLERPEFIAMLKNTPVYYMPIEVDFHEESKQAFDQLIYSYVKRN